MPNAVILIFVSISQRDDELTLRARARVGQVLKDKWRLDKLLGVGGMASVYSATHRNASRVAVKMLHVEFSLDKNIRARFQREGYVANTVGHPGAVRVLDDDVADDGSVFLVMELLEGETIDARWARKGRKLPAEEVLAVTDQLLDVLAAAHTRGTVHRDIKPENIFLTQEGVVKILDFGIARVQELAAGSGATRPGSSMGTPAFMPPEQALGRSHEVDARSDIWAVGAMMFTLLSGQLVHQGNTSNEQLVRAATVHAPSLASVLPESLPLLVEVVDRALGFEKADRWPTAAAMQEAVGRALREQVAARTLGRTPPVRRVAPVVAPSERKPEPAVETKREGAEDDAMRPAIPPPAAQAVAPVHARVEEKTVATDAAVPTEAYPSVEAAGEVPETKREILSTAETMTRSGTSIIPAAHHGPLIMGIAAAAILLVGVAFVLLRGGTSSTTSAAEAPAAGLVSSIVATAPGASTGGAQIPAPMVAASVATAAASSPGKVPGARRTEDLPVEAPAAAPARPVASASARPKATPTPAAAPAKAPRTAAPDRPDFLNRRH